MAEAVSAPETLSAAHQVRIRVGRRGVLTVGPHGRLDGLWRICERELRTNEQVRALCGGITRHTLIAWRGLAESPFPAPVVRLPPGRHAKLELWSRTEVEDWLAARPNTGFPRARS